MKKNIIFILVILFTHLLNAQKKMYSLSESNEVKKLIISEKNVLYISKTDTIIYKLNKTSTGLEVSNAHFSFSISFKNQNQIEILPFHLMIRTNAELYEYLKISILEKNEIQKIGMLFYPVNRFYDDCCLYFNHDIFINDWDKDMYASNFKVFSVLQFDGEKNILKGIYQYKGNILSKISYYKDNEDVEFYKEELVKTTLKYNLYHFRYSAINEKYIIRGSHFRNKVNRVVKAIYKEENMSDGDKSNTEILNYPYPKVEMINE